MRGWSESVICYSGKVDIKGLFYCECYVEEIYSKQDKPLYNTPISLIYLITTCKDTKKSRYDKCIVLKIS